MDVPEAVIRFYKTYIIEDIEKQEIYISYQDKNDYDNLINILENTKIEKENLIKNNDEAIKNNCEKLSGKKDFKDFTSIKGKKLKNHVRKIYIKYKDKALYFEGDGFLPQQVRIMSNYILNNSKKPLNGEYLTLEKVGFSDKLKNLVLMKIDKINDLEGYSEELLLDEIKNIKKIKWIEKNNYFLIFYVNRRDKGEFIGKRGKNIKKYKRIFGNIIIKEI